MDPLSITASVLTVITVCVQSTKALNSLRTTYRDASITISALCTESTVVSASLSQIQTLILQAPDTFKTQFQSNSGLMDTFDIALTGCLMVFSCLQEEIKNLTANINGQNEVGIRGKVRLMWKETNMRDLLGQIRGHQVALTLLVQTLQMNSVSDIHRLLRENRAILDQVASDTQSLRAANPKIDVPQSLLEVHRNAEAVFRDNDSAIDGQEFDFDDICVDSKAYRRVMAAALAITSQKEQVSKLSQLKDVTPSSPGFYTEHMTAALQGRIELREPPLRAHELENAKMRVLPGSKLIRWGPSILDAMPKPGDLLIAIHDFTARSPDELSLMKYDLIELKERDDDFEDGWFLGRHIRSRSTGLFPEGL